MCKRVLATNSTQPGAENTDGGKTYWDRVENGSEAGIIADDNRYGPSYGTGSFKYT